VSFLHRNVQNLFALCLGLSARSSFVYWSRLALCIALISLLRPEGIFLTPILWLLALAFSYSRQVIKTIPLAWIILVSLYPLVLWLIFRLDFYGMPLANTYYAKATGDFWPQVLQGFVYSLPILLACILMFFQALRQGDAGQLSLLAIIAALSAFVVGGGGDWMSHFRLWQPILPVFIIACAYLLQQQIKAKQRLVMLLTAFAMLPALLFFIRPNDLLAALQLQRLDIKEYQEGTMTHESIRLGKRLEQQFAKPDGEALTVAVNHAGALAWAMPHSNMIDMVGLNDATIARAEGVLHAKYDVDYVLNSEPDLIVLNTRVKPGSDDVWYHPGYWQGETALVEDVRFEQYYQATDIAVAWQWKIPWPMSMVFAGFDESWIVVYQRRP